MTIAESPPTSFDMSSNVSLAPAAGLQGPDVGQLRRRRASMQDALDFTKINASLYERPVGGANWDHAEFCSVLMNVGNDRSVSVREQDLISRNNSNIETSLSWGSSLNIFLIFHIWIATIDVCYFRCAR